ncbi:hypothetical protein [Streptomyces sp. CB02959]|uniref:hypothetical protein n=1 Tax=Streptomyces sp. CB02959 TaxID=2020330 RepID=UPI0021530951|nr:hypothetical protein [Streptomyces sp. CB02959]
MPQGPGPRWNPDTQSWETGPSRPTSPYTGPMPPRPAAPPPSAGPTVPGYPPGPPHTPGADDTAGAPEPAVEGGRRTRILIAAVVTAVVAAGAGGAYLLWGRGPDTPSATRPTASVSGAPTATPTATPTGSGASSEPPTADASTPAVPSGYHLAHDEKGFTLAVPDGWQRELRSTGVFYTSPDTRSLLQIFQITEPDLTPEQALQQASKGLSGNPGYQEIGIAPRQGPPGPSGAQLTYAYDSDRLGVRVQAVDCAFAVPDGRQFAVLVLGPASDWPRQETIQRIALESFEPSA